MSHLKQNDTLIKRLCVTLFREKHSEKACLEEANMKKRGKSKSSPTKKKVDKYNSDNKKDESEKIECNQLFTRFASQNVGNALILDAEDLRTTFWLKRRGFTNITVPNSFVYDDIKGDKRITAVNSLVGDYIRDSNLKFTAVWLDYCCSFDGNAEINPQEDLKLLFRKKLVKTDSTFAVTFAFRKYTRVAYVGQDEDRVRTCIENEARTNGFHAISQRTKKYKGMMLLIYKIY